MVKLGKGYKIFIGICIAFIALNLTLTFSGCEAIDKVRNDLLCWGIDIIYGNSFTSPDEFEAPYTAYYYNSLNDTEKTAYIAMYNGILQHKEEVYIPSLTDSEINKVITAITKDDVGIFCTTNKYRFWKGNKVGSVSFSYDVTKEECDVMHEELEDVADTIMSGFTDDMTDYDKELIIHDYIVRNCCYDYAAVEQSDVYVNAYSPYGALVEGKAVCEGYARAMAYMLNKCEIENYLVSGVGDDGKGNRGGHLWNIVEIDGEKYHLDPTFDDPYKGENDFVSHMYFNVSSEQISVDHFDIEIDDSDCTSTAANYFVKSNSLYSAWGEDEKQKVTNALTETLTKYEISYEFRFSTADIYDIAKKDIEDNNAIGDAITKAEEASGIVLDIEKISCHKDDVNFTVWVKFDYSE